MKNFRSIKDLILAVFLSLQGHEIIKTSNDGRVVSFLFEETKEFEEDVRKFENRQGRVEPIAFGETLRRYKGMIFRGGL